METEQATNIIPSSTNSVLENTLAPAKSRQMTNWRSLAKREHLYINPQFKDKVEKEYEKSITEIDIDNDKVDDKYLVLLLAGVRYLANLRGFKSVTFRPVVMSPEYCATVCRILWLPHPDSQGEVVEYEAQANAGLNNTVSFGQKYLAELSENRAFCRCVRNYLNIAVVSREELGAPDAQQALENSNTSSHSDLLLPKLKEQMLKFGYTFDNIKEKLIEREPEAKNWNSIDELPTKWIVWCVERINKKNKAS